MSVAVLETLFQLDKYGWPAHEEMQRRAAAAAIVDDLRSSIYHARKAAEPVLVDAPPPPYVPPSLRRSMSPKSLLICTESLGSETGADYFSSSPTLHGINMDSDTRKTQGDKEEADFIDMTRENKFVAAEAEEYCQSPKWKGRGLMSAASYRRSTGRKSTPARSFPPPLTSISRGDGSPSLHMRTHRRDGRLVVEAVATPSKNYLHALRENGRLLLSFNVAYPSDAVEIEHSQQQNQITEDKLDEIEPNSAPEEEKEEEEEEEEEEEVEVVDRGTVVEVKVLRSSLVINKFVGGSPVSSNAELESQDKHQRQAMTDAVSVIPRRPSPTAATAAAAVVVASSSFPFGAPGSEQYSSSNSSRGGERTAPESEEECHLLVEEKKLLFTCKRRNREEMLQSMRGCSELRKAPLFIWEPCCVATSY